MALTTLFLTTLATLAAAQDVSILPFPVPAAPKCTNTINKMPGCCAPIAAYSTTSQINCGGCALATHTQGFKCLIACPTNTPIDPGLTTTIFSCSPSPTPTPTPPPSPPASMITKACTKTLTSWKPPCGGCVHTEYATTVTEGTDCGGCALEMFTTKINAGVCIQCIQGPQTTTLEATTVTACAASAAVTLPVVTTSAGTNLSAV